MLSFPVSCLFLLLWTLLLVNPGFTQPWVDATFPYRILLKLDLASRGSRAAEQVLVDTFSLVEGNDMPNGLSVDGNCSSDLAFVLTHSGRIAEQRRYWNELACPGTAANPDTSFWIDLPSSAYLQSLTSPELWMYFGFQQVPVSTTADTLDLVLDRSFSAIPWTNGSEVRFFGGACPLADEYEAVTSWSGSDGFFITGCSGSSCDMTYPASGHDHNGSVVSSFFQTDTTASLTIDDVCKDNGGSNYAMDFGHEHNITSTPFGITLDLDPIGSLTLAPPGFGVAPCRLSSQLSIRADIVPLSVSLFLSRPEPAVWSHYGIAEDRYMYMQEWVGGSTKLGVSHTHSSGSVESPVQWTASSQLPYILEVSGAGNSTLDNSQHGHDVPGFIPVASDDPVVTSDLYPHSVLHIYSSSSASSFPLSNSILSNMLLAVDGDFPPYGYSLAESLDGYLIRGASETSTTQVLVLDDAQPHSHSISFSVPPQARHVPNTYPFAEVGSCGGVQNLWPGNPSLGDQTVNHWHDFVGSSGLGGGDGVLPDHRRIKLGMRWASVAITSVGNVQKFGEEDGGVLGVWVYVGIGVGVAVFVLLVLGLIAVTVVIVVVVLVRNRKEGGEMEPDDIDQLMKEDEAAAMAKIKVKSELFEIVYDSVHVTKKIAKGGSNATVFRAEWEGEDVAFKVFQLQDFLEGDRFEEFEKEVEILASVSHPNILRFFGATIHPPRVGIVVEFCPNGDLRAYVSSNSELDLKDRLRLIRETAQALAYLHRKGILHRDMKCDNVLVNAQLKAKVMDFGISRFVVSGDDALKTQRVGTSPYMAPEIAVSGDYTEKVDVYSLGIMLYELMTSNFEPYGPNPYGIELKVANDPQFRPEFPVGKPESEFSADLVKFLRLMWSAEPGMRPTAQEVAEKVRDIEKQTNS